MKSLFAALVVLGVFLQSLDAAPGCCQGVVTYFDGIKSDAAPSCSNVADTSMCPAAMPTPVSGVSCRPSSIPAAAAAGVGVCDGPPLTTTGGMGSVPILRGFDDSTFEFCGRPGHNYSLFASPSLTVNMRLVDAGPEHIRPQGGEGTFAGSLAVMLPKLTLTATVNKAGNMSLTMNGESVDPELPRGWDQVAYVPYQPGVGQVVTITQPPFRFSLVAVKHFADVESGYNRGHLDVDVEITGPVMSSVSGVLGQTLEPDHIDLEEAAFEIPDLIDTSASLAHPQLHLAGSRRLLVQPDSDIFPLSASFASRSKQQF